MKKVMRKVKKRWVVVGAALTVVTLGNQSVAANEATAESTPTPVTDSVATTSAQPVAPASVAPVENSAVQPAVPASSAATGPIENVVETTGTHVFQQDSDVRNEPVVASESIYTYKKGDSVNYDRLVTNDNHKWVSYVSYSGNRRYVATELVSPPQPSAQPAPSAKPVVADKKAEATPAATPKSVELAPKGTYTFTERAAIKNEAKVSSPAIAHYEKGEKVNYDKLVNSDNHQWLSYVSYSGNRRYIAVSPLSAAPKAEVQPSAQPAPSAKPVVADKKAEATPAQESAKSIAVDKKESVSPTTPKPIEPSSKPIVAAEKKSTPATDGKENSEKKVSSTVLNETNSEQPKPTQSSNQLVLEKKVILDTELKAKAVKVEGPKVESNQGQSASQGAYDVVNKVIYLDAGHGGSDPGAMYYGLSEKNLNLDMQNRLKAKLEKQGYKVVMTSAGDTATSLIGRSQKANASNADIFISIHYNAAKNASIQGIETYYYQDYKEYPSTINKAYHTNAKRLSLSNALATAIQNNVVASSKGINRGVKRDTFSVLRETTAPSVLLELGYLSNRSESNKIKSESYREKLANGIVNGINAYYKKL